MNRLPQPSIVITLAFLLVISFTTPFISSCINSDAKNKQSARTELPTLLERDSRLGSPEERQTVLEQYTTLSNAIWVNEKDMKSRLKLVQLFLQEARVTGEHGYYYPAALGILEGILEAKPGPDETFFALLMKASVQLSLHQFTAAKQTAEKAISINPHNALVYGALVDANVELGNYEEAVKMADKMVSIRPDLRSYSRVSYLREIHGEVEGAIEAMKMAVSAGYPGLEETTWCLLTLGHLYETYGDTLQARIQYETALVQRENYPFAIAALGSLAKKQGDFDRAEKLLKKACEIIPEVGFYEDLALLYKETGREKEAQKLSEEILLMLADDEKNGHQMGLEHANVALNLLNDPQTALDKVLKEYALRPLNIQVNQQLAEIYTHLGETEKAKKHLEIAMRTGSRDPELAALNN
ncbi:MAG: tetratricopeptide repeat protein [Bacteroidia bacterium]|nr:tetratricopeptide repeat protein [Bacteroidia bacterium]